MSINDPLGWNNNSMDIIQVIQQITSNRITQLLDLNKIIFGVKRAELQKVTSSKTCWNYRNNFSASLGYKWSVSRKSVAYFSGRATLVLPYPAPHGCCQLLLLPAAHRAKQCGAALTLPTVVQLFSKMTCRVNVFFLELEREGVHVYEGSPALVLNRRGIKQPFETNRFLFP